MTTKSSTKRKKKPFNWNLFLKQKKYTGRELNKAANLASGWTTCACGVQCERIPRNFIGKPTDPRLANLGYNFAYNIADMHAYHCNKAKELFQARKKDAIETLAKIEDRAIVVLKKLSKKNED